MATFSDGEPAPTSPSMSEFANNGLSSIGDMRLHLQNLLDLKEKQLQQAGTLGQQILAQQVELEERVRQLQEVEADKGDDEDLDSDIRDRYRDLAVIVKGWDAENGLMSNSFGSRHLANGSQVVASRTVETPRENERTKAGPSSAAQSRRAKNAAHRADDVEFAFEIGSGLLTEVRRLQSLLAERDKAIEDMKEEKDDLDKAIESLRAGVMAQEQSADKFKEENWNLEVTLQEMRVQLSDAQATTQRLESEHKRLTKLLASSREATDQHKNETERLKGTLDEFKAKHETDVAQARKHAATLQRDKSDLQQLLDSAKADVARANRRLPRLGGSPLTPNQTNGDSYISRDGDEDDLFSPTTAASTNRKKYDNSALFPVDDELSDDSPDPSPLRPIMAPNHPSNEVEALQQRLAHAQRQINTLKGSLKREKELRLEYSRKLESTPRLLGDEENTPNDDLSPAPRRMTPIRVGRGTARGRGRGSLLHRFGQAARHPKSDFGDDDDSDFGTPPAVPEIHASFHDEDEDEFELEHSQVTSSPSLQVASNRTSVDGMDPAFANVLRRSSSQTSIPTNISPLRNSVTARRGRGGTFPRRARGGAAYQDPRPPSLVGAPELLAAELGLGMESASGMESLSEIGTLLEEHTKVETAEFGCQTDFEEPLPRVPTPPPIHISTPNSEMGIQVEPEAIPPVVTVESSIQTEEESKPSRSDMGMQHDLMLPVMISTSVNTDEIPVRSTAQAEVQTSEVTVLDVNTQTPQPPAVIEPPVMVSTSIGTDEIPAQATAQAEVQTSEVVLLDVETQTPQPSTIPLTERSDSGSQTTLYTTSEMDIQTDAEVALLSPLDLSTQRRATITQDSWGSARQRVLSSATIRHAVYHTEETGVDTETDADDYQDARAILTTPSYSNSDDFHSIMTVTDNERSDSDDDDAESIKASRMARRQGGISASSSSSSLPEQTSFYRPQAAQPTYESKGIETEVVEVIPEPAVIPVKSLSTPPSASPKPELREVSVQTDEWKPPPAPTSVAPVSIAVPIPIPAFPSTSAVVPPSPKPAGFGMYRPGPLSNQQFQFISSPAGRPTTPLVPMAPLTPSKSRENSMIRPRTSQSERLHERRESIESALASAMDDQPRSRTTSTIPTPVDKTRPPMMALPPPPKAPPPPSGSMLPPSFIPDKRVSYDTPPPRPTSPPPPELIQRATTPTFGAVLNASGSRGIFAPRQHGSSMPPLQAMRQSPSTSSFRSAANAAVHAHQSPSANAFGRRGEMSSTSLVSGSYVSHRSSLSSDHNVFVDSTPPRATATPDPMADSTGGTTDPNVIHAITQTMIGEFLYKYTRRAIGKGHGERRHKRFFWVHPYTKTLYWSSADPGSSNVSESSAKSTYIENVRAVLDPNPMPPGLYQYSIVISTPSREMKITAPTKERHDIWLNALKYLLSRPGALPSGANDGSAMSPMSVMSELPEEENRPQLMSSPQSRRSAHSGLSADSWNHTPKGQGQRSQSQLSLRGSMGKRSGTPAAEYLRWAERETPYSPSPSKSYEHVGAEDEELSFELHDGNMSDDGYEGMENVRVCCDGRHTVGGHHHDHDPHQQHQQQPSLTRQPHLDVNPRELSRPISPAWSFRSRADSKDSQSLFSRFGSRRSAKTPVNVDG